MTGVCLSLFSIGCSQPTNTPARMKILSYGISQWDSTDVANPASPYDSIGYYHNMILDYAATRQNASWNSDSVYNWVFNFYHDTWGTPIDSIRKEWQHIDSAIYAPNAADTAVADSLYNLLNTPEFVRFDQEAVAIVESSDTSSRAAFLTGIIVIEDSIIGKFGRKGLERVAIVFVAVASGQYFSGV